MNDDGRRQHARRSVYPVLAILGCAIAIACGEVGSTWHLCAKRRAAEERALRLLKRTGADVQTEVAWRGPAILRPILKWSRDFHSVVSLSVEGKQINDAHLAHLEQLPNLASLSLDSETVTGEGLAAVGKATQLTELTLIRCAIDDADLRHLSALSGLKELGMMGTGITSDGLKHIAGLPNLLFFVLVEPNIDDRAVPILGTMTRLVELDLRGCGLTEQGATHVEHLLPKTTIFF